MAYIATYISTTSASELSLWYPEIAEVATADHEQAILWSYDWVNERLDVHIKVPVNLEPTSGRYPASVRDAQALAAKYYLLRNAFGEDAELVVKAKESRDAAIQEVIDNKAHFEKDFSADELGIGQAIAAAANTSTASVYSDRRVKYTGTREKTYTVTITSAGAVETAVWKWDDGEGNETASLTTQYYYQQLESGVAVRFYGAQAKTFINGNTWTVRAVPDDMPRKSGGGLRNIRIER
jgi:hypothetical protein